MVDMPTFKPRRNQNRVDFRPVIWSLRNRPWEWTWNHMEDKRYTIVHRLSDIQIWIAGGRRFYDLHPCAGSVYKRHSSRPTFWDQQRFHWAFCAWKRGPYGETPQPNGSLTGINNKLLRELATSEDALLRHDTRDRLVSA